MSVVSHKPTRKMISRAITVLMIMTMLLTTATVVLGKDKKKKVPPSEQEGKVVYKNIYEGLDLSKFVWPNPPAITRIKYVTYWSGEKLEVQPQQQKKSSWMERVSGVATGGTSATDYKPRWQLITPNGIAIDSKGKVYIADSKVRAIFIVDTETGKYEMIKNGVEARFQWPT